MRTPALLALGLSLLLPWALPETQGAAISVFTPDAVKILPLHPEQPRLYDSDPLRVIEGFDSNLSKYEFLSIPQRITCSFQIHANQETTVYAFGGSKQAGPREFLGADAPRWEKAEGAIKGKNVNLCYRRHLAAGESLDLAAFELQIAAESIALSPSRIVASSAPSMPERPTSLLETLSKQAPNLSSWALAPLDEGVPRSIRENLTALREDLRDEARKPTGAPAAYQAGDRLCSSLIGVLDERDKALVRAGYTAVQADVNFGSVNSQALEARRNHQMSWPQYARENAQRAELKSQAQNNVRLDKERPKLEWATRAAQLRPTLDTLYAQFRSALR